MTYRKAREILERDAEFLGMQWLDFLRFVKDNPGAQKQSVLNAFEVYRAHILVGENA